MSIGGRLKHAWNAFTNNEVETKTYTMDYGSSYSYPSTRSRGMVGNDRSIISSVLNRMAMDVASVELFHVRLDANDRFGSKIDSGLNYCLTAEANVDQAARAFRQDIASTLFSDGVAAIVAVDTTLDPTRTGGFDVKTLRVGEVVEWFPQHVRLNLYNEQKGVREQIILPKNNVAIVENPLYAVMNEPNSTVQRLIRRMGQLDIVDDASTSNKLDMIIQLPYVIKSEARRTQAEQRRKDIEFQLRSSEYGIAYTDGTERIQQLNRPVENQLLQHIEYLTKTLYSQLGITEEILLGTADAQTMLNYNTRTIEPVVDAIVEAMRRVFLTKTARAQNQSIVYIRNPFKLVPINDIAEISDKFTRNEIMSANEIRSIIGFQPSTDPKADELRNSNMPAEKTQPGAPPVEAPADPEAEQEGTT